MKKRLLSVFLVLTMVFALVSCGGKKSGSSDSLLGAQLEEISDMNAGYAEIIMDLDTDLFAEEGMDLSKLSLKITAQCDKDDAAIAECGILYKIDSSEDFEKLTTMVVDKDVVYINLKELKVAAKKLLGKFGGEEYLSVLEMLPDVEYIKIDPSVLSQSGLTSMMSTSKQPSIEFSEKDRKAIVSTASEIAAIIEEAVKNVEPKVVTTEGSKTVVTLNNENVKAAFESLAKTDFSKAYDKIVDLTEDVDSFNSFTSELKNNKKDNLADLKKELEEAANKTSEAGEFALKYTVGVTGSKGKREAVQEISMDVSVDEGSMKLSLSINLDEGKAESISIPTDAMDYMDLMSQLMSGMYNGFGDIE